MRARLLYWEQNGKTMKAEVPYNFIVALLAAAESCGEWIEGKNEFGHWLFRVYTISFGMVVVKEWIPSPGYSWDEIEIWGIEI